MVFRRRKLTDRVQTVVDEVLHLLQKETQSGFQHQAVSVLQAARLEERILMSASPMALVAEGAVQAVEASVAVMETGVELSGEADVELELLSDEDVAAGGVNDDGYNAISADTEGQSDPGSDSEDLNPDESINLLLSRTAA